MAIYVPTEFFEQINKMLFLPQCDIVLKATKEPFFKLRGLTNVLSAPNSNTEDDNQVIRENLMNHAIFINTLAKVTFILLLALFNIIFWTIAFMEHFRSVEDYL